VVPRGLAFGQAICYARWRKESATNTQASAGRGLSDERPWGILVGAIASLMPVIMTDLRNGTAGVEAEAVLLFVGALLLSWWSGRALRPSLFLLAGALACEAVALAAHRGFAVFADTWAPGGALLLVTVPALLAGAALGTCMARRDAGMAAPVLAVLAGYACALLLGWDVVAAGAGLLIVSAVLAWLEPRHALLLGCLLMGTCALAAVLAYFGRGEGPGHLWPVVLPVQAALLTPMAGIGSALGLLIARATRRNEHPAGQAVS
jgi:hypothetical protein